MRNPFTNYSNFTASKVVQKFQSQKKHPSSSLHEYSSSFSSSYKPLRILADEFLEKQKKIKQRAQIQLELYGIETLRYKPQYLEGDRENYRLCNEKSNSYKKQQTEYQGKQKYTYTINNVPISQQQSIVSQTPWEFNSRSQKQTDLRKSQAISDLITVGQQTRCRSNTKDSIINKIDPYSSISPSYYKKAPAARNSRQFFDPYSSNNWNIMKNNLGKRQEFKIDEECENKSEFIMESQICVGQKFMHNPISARPQFQELSSCKEADIESEIPSKSASTLRSYAFVSEYKLKKPLDNGPFVPACIYIRKKRAEYYLVEEQGEYM